MDRPVDAIARATKELSGLPVILAALLAMASLGRFEAEPAAGAETRYLTWLAFWILLGAATLAGRRVAPLAATCIALTATVWLFPPGTVRGASFTIVSILALAAMLATRLARRRRLPLAAWLGLAITSQALLRSRVMLEPAEWGRWLPVLALAALGALAAYELARRQPESRVLVLVARPARDRARLDRRRSRHAGDDRSVGDLPARRPHRLQRGGRWCAGWHRGWFCSPSR